MIRKFWKNERPSSTENETDYPTEESGAVSEDERTRSIFEIRQLENPLQNLEESSIALISENRRLKYKIRKFQKEHRKQQKEISQLKAENKALKNDKVGNKKNSMVCESCTNQLESNAWKREYGNQRATIQSDLVLLENFSKKTEICDEKATNVSSDEKHTTLRGEILRCNEFSTFLSSPSSNSHSNEVWF